MANTGKGRFAIPKKGDMPSFHVRCVPGKMERKTDWSQQGVHRSSAEWNVLNRRARKTSEGSPGELTDTSLTWDYLGQAQSCDKTVIQSHNNGKRQISKRQA